MSTLKFFGISALWAASLLFTSCGSDKDDPEPEPRDTVKPVINITKPQTNALIVAGVNNIIVAGTLTDDRELDECIISIAYTGISSQAILMEDQSLKSVTSSGDLFAGIDDEPFGHDPVVIPLSGKSYSFPDNYDPFGPIPANVRFGEYTITFNVTDKAGNEEVKKVVVVIGQQGVW